MNFRSVVINPAVKHLILCARHLAELCRETGQSRPTETGRLRAVLSRFTPPLTSVKSILSQGNVGVSSGVANDFVHVLLVPCRFRTDRTYP